MYFRVAIIELKPDWPWQQSNSLFFFLQNFQYRCCGAVSFDEWQNSIWLSMKSDSNILVRSNVNRTVPDSCCITYREYCGKSDHPSNIPYTGCVYKFIDEMRDHLNLLNVISLGPSCIQLFGITLSCFLYFNIK